VESMAKTQIQKPSKRDGKDVKCTWRTAGAFKTAGPVGLGR
jgi:hypothetical protein